jgi:hypothetical protein
MNADALAPQVKAIGGPRPGGETVQQGGIQARRPTAPSRNYRSRKGLHLDTRRTGRPAHYPPSSLPIAFRMSIEWNVSLKTLYFCITPRRAVRSDCAGSAACLASGVDMAASPARTQAPSEPMRRAAAVQLDAWKQQFRSWGRQISGAKRFQRLAIACGQSPASPAPTPRRNCTGLAGFAGRADSW